MVRVVRGNGLKPKYAKLRNKTYFYDVLRMSMKGEKTLVIVGGVKLFGTVQTRLRK